MPATSGRSTESLASRRRQHAVPAVLLGLLLASAWFAAGWGVDRLVCRAPESPSWQQAAVCVLFGVLTCLLLLRIAALVGLDPRPRRGLLESWEFLVPVAAYAWLWGRHHFLGFSYWDEMTRNYWARMSLWELVHVLLAPVASGHVMPVARLYWYAIDSTFHARYIGVAAGSFVFSVAAVMSAHALIRAVSPERWRLVSLVPALVVAATPHSPVVELWKGAGDSLVLALSCFLSACVLFARVALGRSPAPRRDLAWASAGLLVSMFSSPMVAIAPVYLFPFLLWDALGGERRVRFAAGFGVWIGATAAAWLVYAWLRRRATGQALPPGSWSWAAYSGSLEGGLELYLPSPAIRAIFLLGSAAVLANWVRILSRAPRPPSSIAPAMLLWMLGVEMFLVGTAQVVWARGMTYEDRRILSEYHLFLPFSGLALSCAALLVLAGSCAASAWSRRERSTLLRVAAGVLSCGGMLAYAAYQRLRVERTWPLLTAFPLEEACAPDPLPKSRTRITVIQARAQLETDLRECIDRMLAEASRTGARREVLPDLALVDSPLFPEFCFWPAAVNSSPDYAASYRKLSRIRFLLYFFDLLGRIPPDSPIRVVPPENVPPADLAALYRDPATGPFLEKYWPRREIPAPR